MIDIKLLEEVLPDIDDWSYGDLKEIKLLTKDNIKELTKDLDDVCDNDILSLCVTALHYMREVAIEPEDILKLKRNVENTPLTQINEPYVSKVTPLDIRDETTEAEKCEPITYEERETADDIMSDACGRLMCMGSYFDKV